MLNYLMVFPVCGFIVVRYLVVIVGSSEEHGDDLTGERTGGRGIQSKRTELAMSLFYQIKKRKHRTKKTSHNANTQSMCV